jgi:AraC family ethanolamine operon transcriptional activator
MFFFGLSTEGAGSILPLGLPAQRVYGTLLPLVAAALERFDTHKVEASKCLTKRLAAVRLCESYIREHCSEAVTLLDLSRISGMTSRSLTNAFEAVAGLSPVDYLRRLRLSGAHNALLLANKKNTKVTEVATAWGFWHMGHFTYYYRKMFGETPSQTLANS